MQGVGFGRRLAGYLIDVALHYVTAFTAGVFLGILIAVMAAITHQPVQLLIARFVRGSQWPSFLLAIVGFFLYRSIMEGLHGSTVGKMMLGMTVVQEDGTPCRFGSALIRELGLYIDGLFFGLIGYMHMQKNNMLQRYGDDWAHTVVCLRKDIKAENIRGTGAFVGALVLGILADLGMLLLGYTLRMS